MRNPFRLSLTALVLLAAVPLAVAQGTWSIHTLDDGRLQLQLQWGSSTSGNPVARGELRGLTDAQIAAPTETPVAFRLEREPGTFAFSPDEAFAAVLRQRGVEGAVSDRDLFALALVDVTVRYVAEMSAEWPRGLTVEDLVPLRALGVTTASLAELDRLGYPAPTPDEAVRLRAVGVTPAYVRELADVGLTDLSGDDLVRLKALDVTAAYVRELRAADYRDLTPARLAQLRALGRAEPRPGRRRN